MFIDACQEMFEIARAAQWRHKPLYDAARMGPWSTIDIEMTALSEIKELLQVLHHQFQV